MADGALRVAPISEASRQASTASDGGSGRWIAGPENDSRLVASTVVAPNRMEMENNDAVGNGDVDHRCQYGGTSVGKVAATVRWRLRRVAAMRLFLRRAGRLRGARNRRLLAGQRSVVGVPYTLFVGVGVPMVLKSLNNEGDRASDVQVRNFVGDRVEQRQCVQAGEPAHQSDSTPPATFERPAMNRASHETTQGDSSFQPHLRQETTTRNSDSLAHRPRSGKGRGFYTCLHRIAVQHVKGCRSDARVNSHKMQFTCINYLSTSCAPGHLICVRARTGGGSEKTGSRRRAYDSRFPSRISADVVPESAHLVIPTRAVARPHRSPACRLSSSSEHQAN